MVVFERHLRSNLNEALDAFRVAVLHGARQCGKTTLARLVMEERKGAYATLDDDATREAALNDPITFLAEQSKPLTVDEVQLGGDRLIMAVKQLVDVDPAPGRFLLTGSTNFLTVPTISESLAGRVRILRLWPLSQAELAGRPPVAIDRWFGQPAKIGPGEHTERRDYLDRVCRGGYPEVVGLASRLRDDWFDSYLETVFRRDLFELTDIRRKAAIPRLLRWAAAATATELNVTSVARDLGIDRSTVVSYLEWLQTVFLVHVLPQWSRNYMSRTVRRPKLHLTDTGIAASLLGVGPAMLIPATATATGPLLETFAVNEVARLLSHSTDRVGMFHYRDYPGREIDLVLERRDGAIVAIEIKATSSPTGGQLSQVRWLRDRLDRIAPGTFRAGILLHTGPQSLTVGDRLHLRPISMLWSTRTVPPE